METDDDTTASVLIVSPPDRRGSIVRALEGVAAEIQTETSADLDAGQLRSADCLVCVVRGQSGNGWPACLDVDAEAPVIVVADRPTESLLSSVAERGGTVVPATQLDVLPKVLETAVSRRSTRQHFSAVDQLFDAVDQTLFVKDTEGRHRYLSANPELPHPEVAIGKTDRELFENRFAFGEQWYEDDMQVLETGDPILDDVETYDDEYGNEIHNRVSVVPWHDGDRIRGVVGIRQEVTEQVDQTEELQRKNRNLDRFVEYLTHDLQTPLQIASGYLELAREGDDRAFDRVDSALDRIEDLVDDMEALARGDHAEHRSPQSHSVLDILEEIWAPLDAGQATLLLDVPKRAVVYAEVTELRPFFENLLKNSLAHGPDDVTITVGTLNDGFYLEDDGPGIPEEHRGAIFRQGFTTSDAGSGTGLSIVADAAHTHGWDITVTESDGGGARFEIRNCLVVTPPSNELGTGEALALTDNCDVGNPTVSGETVLEEKGRATLRGAGADIYGADNEFQFAYTEVTGDVRISARITDLDPQHSFSKAGLMIRDALAADARHAHVGQTPEFGTELLWRTEAGEPTVSQQLQERYDDEWFRIDRVGNEVTCWISPDGDDWHPIDQRSVHFEDPIYVGLAVSSVVPRNLATGRFENVAIHRLKAR